MRDPFRIAGPTCISFSGGRTSAYLLWRVLEAHAGKLPEDARVLFCNTGKEEESTMRFVRECGVRWGFASEQLWSIVGDQSDFGPLFIRPKPAPVAPPEGVNHVQPAEAQLDAGPGG